MKPRKWINVTLRLKVGYVPGLGAGIKVWAENNLHAMEVAETIIDLNKWIVLSAGPSRED